MKAFNWTVLNSRTLILRLTILTQHFLLSSSYCIREQNNSEINYIFALQIRPFMTLPEDLHAWRIYSLSFFNQIFMKLSKDVLYDITNYFEFDKFSFLLKICLFIFLHFLFQSDLLQRPLLAYFIPCFKGKSVTILNSLPMMFVVAACSL